MRNVVFNLVATERTIQLADEINLHTVPVPAKARQLWPVGWDTAALLLRCGPLVFGPEHCLRQRADRRNKMRDKAGERANVVFAITQDVPLLLGAKRRPPQSTVAHLVLANHVNLVFEKIAQCVTNAEKPFIAIAAFDGAVVHVMAKLKIGVERAGRFAPAFRNMKAKLGSKHVANDQCVTVETVRRR